MWYIPECGYIHNILFLGWKQELLFIMITHLPHQFKKNSSYRLMSTSVDADFLLLLKFWRIWGLKIAFYLKSNNTKCLNLFLCQWRGRWHEASHHWDISEENRCCQQHQDRLMNDNSMSQCFSGLFHKQMATF